MEGSNERTQYTQVYVRNTWIYTNEARSIHPDMWHFSLFTRVSILKILKNKEQILKQNFKKDQNQNPFSRVSYTIRMQIFSFLAQLGASGRIGQASRHPRDFIYLNKWMKRVLSIGTNSIFHYTHGRQLKKKHFFKRYAKIYLRYVDFRALYNK